MRQPCWSALNRLWGLDRPLQELAELGLALGADVPVFVHGQAAWAEGVGERLAPVGVSGGDLPPGPPDVSVATAEVFQAPELTRDSPVIKIPGFLAAGGRNDFEPVVRRRYPAVAEALDWLGQYAPRPVDRHRVVRVRGDAGRADARAALAAIARASGAAMACGVGTGRRCSSVCGSRKRRAWPPTEDRAGVSPSGKAAGFDPAIRRFESFHPSQIRL